MVRTIMTAGMVLGIWTLAACTPAGKNIRVDSSKMPPFGEVELLAKTFSPKAQTYKLAVLTFIDQTSKASLVTDPVADIMTTELFNTGRFELYDRSDLTQARLVTSRTVHATDSSGKEVTMTGVVTGDQVSMIPDRKTNDQYGHVLGQIDGIFLGYITAFQIEGNKGSFDFDYRIVNGSIKDTEKEEVWAREILGLVVFSGNGRVSFTTNESNTSVNIGRADITTIASQVKDKFVGSFGKLSSADQIKVTNIEGRHVTINIGSNDNIQRGFTGFVVRPTRQGTYDYLAEFVILNVFPGASVATVIGSEDYASNVRLGDIVRIK